MGKHITEGMSIKGIKMPKRKMRAYAVFIDGLQPVFTGSYYSGKEDKLQHLIEDAKKAIWLGKEAELYIELTQKALKEALADYRTDLSSSFIKQHLESMEARECLRRKK